jgi:hypothetical protein
MWTAGKFRHMLVLEQGKAHRHCVNWRCGQESVEEIEREPRRYEIISSSSRITPVARTRLIFEDVH